LRFIVLETHFTEPSSKHSILAFATDPRLTLTYTLVAQ
jgi:hypothetical protein